MGGSEGRDPSPNAASGLSVAAVTCDEQIALTWYQFGEPLLVHTQPNVVPGRPYGIGTVLIPAFGARLTRNGTEAIGRPWRREREGRTSSTCVLGLCESWTEAG